MSEGNRDGLWTKTKEVLGEPEPGLAHLSRWTHLVLIVSITSVPMTLIYLAELVKWLRGDPSGLIGSTIGLVVITIAWLILSIPITLAAIFSSKNTATLGEPSANRDL